jgi:stage V sporulation protein S
MEYQTSPDLDLDPNTVLVKVSASSAAKDVAASIAHNLYARKRVQVRAIGAGAVNQAVKATAIARGYVASRGIDLIIRPGFATVDGDDGQASAVTLLVIGT